ncbi:MAG: DUF1294 domain-containing protein [Clostridiales bacterium]|jgi:uncharacterized membrane protein YsdA (DUF1294 family)|nr:DUF1294 domain-containing protein [Clostridiales bacterium]
MPVNIYCFGYLIIINFIAAILTVSDKRRAIRHRRRIRERTLLLAAALGGSPALWITMKCIRHKTRHKKFMIGVPLIFAAQAAALYFILSSR